MPVLLHHAPWFPIRRISATTELSSDVGVRVKGHGGGQRHQILPEMLNSEYTEAAALKPREGGRHRLLEKQVFVESCPFQFFKDLADSP